jgi:hypothetical protein
MAAQTGKKVSLSFCLDALGDYRQAHRLAQGNDALRNGAAAGIDEDIPDKLLVNLQLVQGQTPQVGEGRIPHAEIVQRESQTVRL